MSQSASGHSFVDFATTHWSMLADARVSDGGRRQAVLEFVTQQYWTPVYSYVRACRYQSAEAADITQDFFVEVVLGRDLIGKADRERGRFRTFLLYCLRNYLRERHRRGQSRQRSVDRLTVSVPELAAQVDAEMDSRYAVESPEQIYHRNWALNLLTSVIEDLRRECVESGLEQHFTIYYERSLRPILERCEPTSLAVLADQFGISVKQASNLSQTVRRRFQRSLMDSVSLTVEDEAMAASELEELIRSLSPNGEPQQR
jgi:RNA polymerase sigma-70 factor (ECF subfamily)